MIDRDFVRVSTRWNIVKSPLDCSLYFNIEMNQYADIFFISTVFLKPSFMYEVHICTQFRLRRNNIVLYTLTFLTRIMKKSKVYDK